MADDFTVEQWPDEFIVVDNSDDWTIYTTTETTYTLEFQAVGLNDAAIAVAARNEAVAAQVQADADVVTITAMMMTVAGGTTGQILIKASNADYDFGWMNPTGMLTAIYDPTNIAADVFARANHTGTQLAATISDFNTAADARVSAAIGVTVQAYSAVLAATTASYTVALDTKLGGIAAGADVTVSALPVAVHAATSKATPVNGDEFALIDSAASFGLKKLFWNNLLEGVRVFFYATNKAPVDADLCGIADSAASFAPKYSTFTQIKAFLKTYFDTLYQPVSAVLTGLAALSQVVGSRGIVANVSANSFIQRVMTAGIGMSITNGDGVSGDPTFALANGTVVDSVVGTYATNANLSTVIPHDDTIPQNTEGTQIISVTITPKSTTNKLRCRFRGQCALDTAANACIAALFQNSVASAINAVSISETTIGYSLVLALEHEFVPGSTSTQTIAVRVGASAGIMRMNGNTSGRVFGGVNITSLVVEEIKA